MKHRIAKPRFDPPWEVKHWLGTHTLGEIIRVALWQHLVHARDGGVARAARRLGISRSTFYRWWGKCRPGRRFTLRSNRYGEGG